MGDQEKELLESYRQLGPESKRFIMSTVIAAFTNETSIKQQHGFLSENSPGAISSFPNSDNRILNGIDSMFNL